MPQIRIALVGLSVTAKVSWAAEAHLPYLLSKRGQSQYRIVALLNSSITAAESSKRLFKLDALVKAYGDPSEVAADPDVDMVVCNTRVDVHFSSVEPSLRAGKAVFVEWPLVESLARAEELAGLQRHDENIIGLQGRVSPLAIKLKEILAAGRIGTVLSSKVRAFASLLPRDTLPETLTYFADRNIGGNPIKIEFAHMIDLVHHVLGDFASFESRMQIQRPTLGVLDSSGKQTGTVTSDVPDFLAMQGPLAGNGRDVASDATLSVTYRSGPPFKGDSPFVWTINGTNGELKVTGALGEYLHSSSYDEPPQIQLHDHASDQLVDIKYDWQEWQLQLPVRSRITAELYERYAQWVELGKPARGDLKERDWPRLDDAVERMREFETLFKQFDARERR